jgi:hypothetical protein
VAAGSFSIEISICTRVKANAVSVTLCNSTKVPVVDSLLVPAQEKGGGLCVGLIPPLPEKRTALKIQEKPWVKQRNMNVLTVSQNGRILFMHEDLWEEHD